MTSRKFRPPNLWTKTKTQKSGAKHKYFMAGWRGRDGKQVTVYIGTCSMGRDAASEIALERKIRDLTANNLQPSDFVFAHEEPTQELADFIVKYEFLHTLSLYPSDWFTARYRGLLGGVVVMEAPVAESKMMGDNTKDLERLISRGASAGWSPPNLASWLISRAITYMVDNTQYRLFIGYSDPLANEQGIIYQACLFAYVGDNYGTGWQWKIAPNKWTSSRHFRSRSVYKRLAKADGIAWSDDWQDGDRVFFDRMPEDVAKRIRQLSKEYQASCEKRRSPPKRKYVYLAGKNKREARQLAAIFLKHNKIYPYPDRNPTK